MSTIVIIGSQKGGVGKSTLTSIMCNYMHNERKDTTVIAVDADPQASLLGLRAREVNAAGNDLMVYDILEVNPKDCFKMVATSLVGEYDYIFIDLPGNLGQDGVLQTYKLADYIIMPTGTSEFDIASLRTFREELDEIVAFRKKGNFDTVIKAVLNRVNKSTVEYQLFSKKKKQIGKKLNVDFLKSDLPDSVPAFQRGASTIKTYQHRNKGVVSDFCKEVMKVISK